MRSIVSFSLLLSLVLPILSKALMVPPQLHVSAASPALSRSAASASIPEEPLEYSQEDEMLFQKVRQELVQKYLDQGDELSKAEREVDYFLGDRARSQEYMEMRKYNLSQLNDGLGLDLFLGLQFISAFFIGFMVHAMQN